MKVLFLSNLYPPNVCGGYEQLCFSVASALAEKGHTVGVLTSSYGGASADYPGQQVWRSLLLLATEGNIYEPFCPTPQLRNDICGHNLRELHRVVEEFSPDILFVWNLYFFDASLLHAIEGSYGHKAVYFLTDNWLISFFHGDFLGWYFPNVVFGHQTLEDAPAQEPVALRGRAIFGARFMERFYASAGLTFSHTAVIHNGVCLPSQPEAGYRDRLLPVRKGALRLLFAGRVVDVKGVHTLLSALPLVTAALPDVAVSLDIVGDCQDDGYRARLDAILAKDGTAPLVRFRKPVGLSTLFDLFQDFDVYVFPSLYEPFALTLIHALHAGIPTVASAVGGNVEIVFDRDTGRTYPRDDVQALAACIVDLYREPLTRNRLSRRAREAAWGFTFATMVTRIVQELSTAAGGA
jgi:glycosyltransferase involved in cell wall biosynthesis